ncbi:MAG: extracellular solute-binding protein [Hungatella sp.]|nr:extracellular solute-binding protein [Hungatella sp.]
MRKRRVISMLAAVSVAAYTLLGCSGGGGQAADSQASGTQAQTEAGSEESGSQAPASSGKTVLRMSVNMTHTGKEIMTEVMEDILKDYPNVELQIEETAQDSYVSKMAMDVSTDNVADLIQYWRPDSTTHGCPKYIENGSFADISELLESDTFKDMFTDDAVANCTVDGKLYAIPAEFSFIMFLANKEILDDCGLKVPETWDELLASMDVLKEHGYIPWGVSTKAYASAWERPLGYVFTRHCTFFGENGVLNLFGGKSHFTDENAMKACEDLARLVGGNCAVDSMTLDDSQATAKYMNTGQACYFINGSYGLPHLSDEVKEKLVAIRFPEIPGAAGDTGKIQDKSLTAVYYASAKAWEDPLKKEIITKFFEKVSGPDIAARKFLETGSLTPVRDMELSEDNADRVFLESKALADDSEQILWFLSTGDPNKRDSFYSFYTELWLGDITGEEFARRCEELFCEQ